MIVSILLTAVWVVRRGAWASVNVEFGAQVQPLENRIDVCATVNVPTGSLNTLMASEFAKWDAMLTRYLSTNGTISDFFDFSQSTINSTATLAGVAGYMLGLYSFYSATNDVYYLAKLRYLMDQIISDPFFTVSTDKGTANYVPQYFFNGEENDPACMLTMYAAGIALKLYALTGDSKYKAFADDVAYQSRNWFVVVDNATDLAWSSGYYDNRDLAHAETGVNRQGAIAWFYSEYAAYNASYADYVPLILHWIWRAQLTDNSLSYNLGSTVPDTAYTAFSLFDALEAYGNVPTEFSGQLITHLNNTLGCVYNYTQTSGLNYLQQAIDSAVLVRSITSGFLTSPSSDIINATVNTICLQLNTLNFGQYGLSDTAYERLSYRWPQYFLGCLFSCYPLPSSLSKTYYVPQVSFAATGTSGRYLWNGTNLLLKGVGILFVGDSDNLVGMSPSPFWVSAVHKVSGNLTRSLTSVNGVGVGSLNWSTEPQVTAYYYGDYSFHSMINGASEPYIDFPANVNMTLFCANGTTVDTSTLGNGTVVIDGDFMLYQNVTPESSQDSLYVRFTGGNGVWNVQTTTYLHLTGQATTNYNFTSTFLTGWQPSLNASFVYALLRSRADHVDMPAPLSFDQQLIYYQTELQTISQPTSWETTYGSAVSTTLGKLVAISNPESNYVQNWTFEGDALTLTFNVRPASMVLYWAASDLPSTIYGSTFAYDPNTKLLTLAPTGTDTTLTVSELPSAAIPLFALATLSLVIAYKKRHPRNIKRAFYP